MTKRVLASAVLALGAAVVAAAQTTPTKIGVIQIQAAIISTREGKKAAADLEARSAPKKKELEKQQAEINALRDQLQKSSNTASEDIKQKLMRDIDTKTKSFNRSLEDAQAELDQEQNRLLQELGGKIMAVIDKYAKDNGYALIVDISSQQTPVVYAASAIDVTKEIIDLYDKNVPAAGAAPTSAAPAAPRPAPPSVTPPKAAPGAATPAPKPPAPKPGTPK